jgi:hypothetical protein
VLAVVVAAADGVEVFGVGFAAAFPRDRMLEVAVAAWRMQCG